MNVWVLMGDEGYLYGVFATEPDAWTYVAYSARRCYLEAGHEHCPENIEDVVLHWTIECNDRLPNERKITARERPHDGAIGDWYLESIDIDLASLPALSAIEKKEHAS